MQVTHRHTSVPLIGFVIVMTLGCDGSNGPATGPTTGAIHITVSTEGANADLDTDGYGVMLDGRAPMAIDVQAALTITHLAPGRHLVNLDGLASNCYIVAANQRQVQVVAGALAQLVAYNIQCIPRPSGGECGWDCDLPWSQSTRPSRYDAVTAKGSIFKAVRGP